MSDVHKGGCLCGKVRFETRGDLREVVYCHCSQCRKQSGHYFAATRVEVAKLDIEGADNLTWFAASDDAKRGFCKTCGSALFWRRDEGPNMSILAGAFDDPSPLKAAFHIYVADKGDYYTIDDGLPQFAKAD